MGLCVTFVSGLRRSGKSAVIRSMIDRLCKRQPHYIRLAKSGGDKKPPPTTPKPPDDCGLASARWLTYDDERAFDVLPGALAAIHREDRFGTVVIEADDRSVESIARAAKAPLANVDRPDLLGFVRPAS